MAWDGGVSLPARNTRHGLQSHTRCSLWSRFFCLSVYITMYLNDHARSAFYEALGLNTNQFNRHVILETNNSTERVFPEVRAWPGWAGAWVGGLGGQKVGWAKGCVGKGLGGQRAGWAKGWVGKGLGGRSAESGLPGLPDAELGA